MSGFLGSVQKLAAYSKSKAEQGVAYLRAAPVRVQCEECSNDVMVPPGTFDWECGQCGVRNPVDEERCEQCETVRVKGKEEYYRVQCTMCTHLNDVPRSNVRKHLLQAKKTTVAVAKKGSEIAKKEYKHQKSTPAEFHCRSCSAMLRNPNPLDADVNHTYIDKVTCPICHQITSVPQRVIADKLGSLSSTLSKGAARVYYSVAGKPFADCPTCHQSNVLPPKQDQEESKGLAQAHNQRITVTCSQCKAQFPTTY